ncbi:GNAT family N-acetyltransferase [Methanoplanus sp. FWC-SCC4]|uniref:GNAT family N-acetyltransferase n=2 Tax=Methanochimaera problematica TaxID=2609417 RepID=A0AA97I3F1_9EURY|nr:GNAT family N-acetyltransferase [Methanoplanus sp. FWC-SCC4]
MEEITIEKLTEENFPVFTSLIEKLAVYEKLTPPGNDEKCRLQKDAFSENPKYEAYLAVVNGVPAGYITFYFTYSTFLAKSTLYLEDLFVLEECRKKGIGRKLFDFCRSEAAKRGCGRMDWTVLTWNKPSIEFYEKSGAKRQDWYLYRFNEDKF